MPVTLITTTEQWKSIASDWNRLASHRPFYRWEWLSTWWEHFGANRELCILAVHDGDTFIGAAPWYRERTSSFGCILRTLGSGEVCSEYVTMLSAVGQEAIVAEAISAWLVEGFSAPANSPNCWDLLALECVPAIDAATNQLVGCLEKSGCFIQNVSKTNCWRINLPATWPEYLSMLSKSHRKHIKRLMRDFRESDVASLWTAQDASELSRGMKLLEELHQRRWNAIGRPGVFADVRFREFLFDVAPRLQAAGVLQLVVLELDGRPAAVDFHLVTGEANYAYQGGIEPELAHESPGGLMTAMLIHEAIACGKKYFDFLRGDELYKPHFRATATPTRDVHVVPPRTSSQIRHGLWRTGVTMKNLFKSGMSLAGIQ